jgi:thiol:disulfide interchange protein DsbD
MESLISRVGSASREAKKGHALLKKNFFIALILVALAAAAWAQGEPVEWSAKAPAKVVRAGEKFELTLTANISDGWHIYSFTQPTGGPATSQTTVPPNQPFQQVGAVSGPAPHKIFDPNFEMETESYEGTVAFKLPVVAGLKVSTAIKAVAVDVKFQACSETTCLPPRTVHLSAPVKIAAAGANRTASSEVGAETTPPPSTSSQQPAGQLPVAMTVEAVITEPVKATAAPALTAGVQGQSLGSFIWLAAIMGALSLLTPCVFPMIPITVSYFTNHASGNRRTAVFTALIYGIGIIMTFTALGMLLAIVFGAGGVNQLAANPWVNLVITAIFLGFAFSLFGAYFLQVPPGLMNKLDAITRSKEGSDVIGALLMGFTFTLTSFTCTAPFVGTLLVMTAQGNWRWPLAGMLAFSTVFAVPFFILALAPQLMSKLPKAGGWMAQVKAVMGFLEIAAAMKFLSNADLVWQWGIFTRQVVLAVWIGIGLLTVLYVLGYFRIEHDSQIESVGAVRITIAIIFLATTVWLIPGLLGRQLGELESFLPPENGAAVASYSARSLSSTNLRNEAGWIHNDYEGAMATAQQQNKLVFVDFTGYTCTNCRWMESNMFSRPEVAKEMEKFVRVRLYTDGEGEVFQRQQKMQQEKFGTVALPYYAILRPNGTAVNVFPGLTRNVGEFTAFLQGALPQ